MTIDANRFRPDVHQQFSLKSPIEWNLYYSLCGIFITEIILKGKGINQVAITTKERKCPIEVCYRGQHTNLNIALFEYDEAKMPCKLIYKDSKYWRVKILVIKET